MILTVEGRRTNPRARVEDVRRAATAMQLENGPTYVVLESPDHCYVQAAGSGGRFVVEARDVYGEGFRHWRAFRPGATDDAPTVVTFRNRCPRDTHPPRGCPIAVLGCDVVELGDVAAALLQFAADCTRTTRLQWRDVSAEFLRDDDPPIVTLGHYPRQGSNLRPTV